MTNIPTVGVVTPVLSVLPLVECGPDSVGYEAYHSGGAANEYLVAKMIDRMIEAAQSRPLKASFSAFMNCSGSQLSRLVQLNGPKHTSYLLPREAINSEEKRQDFDAFCNLSDEHGSAVRVGVHPFNETAAAFKIQNFHHGSDKSLMSFLHQKAILMVWEPDPETDNTWMISYAVFTAAPDRLKYHKDAIAAGVVVRCAPETAYEDLPFIDVMHDMDDLCQPRKTAETLSLAALQEQWAGGKIIIDKVLSERRRPQVVPGASWLTPYSGNDAYNQQAEEMADLIWQAEKFACVGTEHGDCDHPVMQALINHDIPNRYLLISSGDLSYPQKRDELIREARAAGVTVLRNSTFTMKVVVTSKGYAVSSGNFVGRTSRCIVPPAIDNSVIYYQATTAECLGTIIGRDAETRNVVRDFMKRLIEFHAG